MKIHILSPDGRGQIDGTVTKTLLDFLPQRVASLHEADVVVVPISFYPDYTFNQELRSVGQRPWVMIDFTEYGSSWNQAARTHLFGGTAETPANLLENGQWGVLHAFAAEKPPAAYFKRELLHRDRSERVHPVEFPCSLPPSVTNRKEDFDARPIEVFNCWGYSHASRPRLHGDIFHGMATHGLEVLSDWEQVNHLVPGKRNWVSIYSPWFVRKNIGQILSVQDKSKISVSLPGAGTKCFRSAESPLNSIMALPFDDLAWSYPWVDGLNCLRLTQGGEFTDLELFAASGAATHAIYVESQENLDRYRSRRYVNEYILPTIEKSL